MGPEERLVYTMSGLHHLTASRTLTGDDARRAAAQILPHVNSDGARTSVVRDAVQVLEDVGSVDSCFSVAARQMKRGRASFFANARLPGTLGALPAPLRLALEMAAHEEIERRALEGELAELREAWRNAEEIAQIADDMFVPSGVEAALIRLKGMK